MADGIENTLAMMDSGFKTPRTTIIPPLLRLGDDVIELIVDFRLYGPRWKPRSSQPFATAVKLSHVCSRLRHIMLTRQSFWVNIKCSQITPLDAVMAAFVRAGTAPLDIRLYRRTSRRRRSTNAAFSPEVLKAVFWRMHRAAIVTIDTRLAIDADRKWVTPLPYAERPLRELVFECSLHGHTLSLIGPKLTKLAIHQSRAKDLNMRQLHDALAAAPSLQHLAVEFGYISTDNFSLIETVTSVDIPSSAPRGLSCLMLDDCYPMHVLLSIVLHLFPMTPTLAQFILFRDTDPEVLYADLPGLFQLDQLGSASLIHMPDSGREYEITFQNRHERAFRLPDNFQHDGDSRSFEIMLRVFSSAETFQIDDSEGEFPDNWLKQWHGSTWSSLVTLNLNLFNIEYQWVDSNRDDQWIADASQRISLPSLRKITISSDAFDGYEEDWGAACAVLLDTFFYPADVTIAFENDTGTDKQFRAAIDNAYRIRYGRGYFPAVDADMSDKNVDDVPLSEDETDNVPVSVFKPEKNSSEP